MLESNTVDELGTPLLYQRAPSSGGSVGNDDRYDDALGSVTSAKRISANSLIDSIFTDGEGKPRSPTTSASTGSGDEADAAAGVKLPREATKVTTFVLAAILFFNAGGELHSQKMPLINSYRRKGMTSLYHYP